NVSLAVTTNSTSLSCNLSPTSIPGGSGSSSLSCTGQSADNYLALVTGASSSLSHSTSVVYHVTNAPTFSVTASPTSLAVNSGVAGTSTITVSPQNGFTGTVTFSVGTNPFWGLTVMVEVPATPERSEEHTSELQSRFDLVCRLLLEKKK